jgi:C4-dicarboxylate-specific signal transduction histidine kinase
MKLEELKIAIESAPVTISWISSDLKYLGVNPLLAMMMNKSVDEIVGTELGSYTEQPFIKEFAQELFNTAADELSQEIYTIIEDEERWFHILGRKYDHNTKATLIGIEITKQKESQRKTNLLEKLALIGEMASGLIHEINNPLTTINLKTMKLKKIASTHDSDIHQQVSEIANDLIKTENRIADIIKTMKEFAHTGDESTIQQKQVKDIATTITHALDVCQGKIKASSINISYNVQHQLQVPIYETEIIQILVNLITNSIDATQGQENPWIKIVAYQKENYLFLSVSDSGKGIPPHLQKKILEPFFTTKEKGKGTGIGLGLCQKFALHHGGSFFIDNTSPNTKFTLKIPI